MLLCHLFASGNPPPGPYCLFATESSDFKANVECFLTLKAAAARFQGLSGSSAALSSMTGVSPASGSISATTQPSGVGTCDRAGQRWLQSPGLTILYAFGAVPRSVRTCAASSGGPVCRPPFAARGSGICSRKGRGPCRGRLLNQRAAAQLTAADPLVWRARVGSGSQSAAASLARSRPGTVPDCWCGLGKAAQFGSTNGRVLSSADRFAHENLVSGV